MIEDIEILKKAKNGDPLATDQILSDYKNIVIAIARRFYLMGGDRDDLIQEGMIGLFKAINSFDLDKNIPFKNYAGRLIEREMISAIRRENTNNNQVLDESLEIIDNLSDEKSPEREYLSEENIQEFTKEMKKVLSPFEIKVVNLYLKGYTYIDIAKLLNKSNKSVDNALFRIKKKLTNLRGNL